MYATVQRCIGAMVQRCIGATVHRCNGATVQQFSSFLLPFSVDKRGPGPRLRCNGATVQQCNSATVQQCNGKSRIVPSFFCPEFKSEEDGR